jgi:hypothetical protein
MPNSKLVNVRLISSENWTKLAAYRMQDEVVPAVAVQIFVRMVRPDDYRTYANSIHFCASRPILAAAD